jgi:uncharacterized protein (TIGR02646 family)
MVTIEKGQAPKAWIEKRTTPGFTGFESTEELKTALLDEQGHICAYCMRRIPTSDPNMDAQSRVEHIKPRSKYPDLQLDYNNLVICCPGNIVNQPHCDHSKGDELISFDLFSSQLEDSITYSKFDGTIQSGNETWDKELNDVLNLNHPMLKANRKQMLDGVITTLNIKKDKSTGWPHKAMQTELNRWQNRDKTGKRLAFAGIVIAFLKKRLRTQ